MKKELLAVIVCPVCKGSLKPRVKTGNSEEVENGVLYCARCDVNYPISDGIAAMLPPEALARSGDMLSK